MYIKTTTKHSSSSVFTPEGPYSKIFFFASLSFLFILFFQKAYANPCPNYLFSVDLAKGSVHEDVHILQEILNLDKRTMVAQTGPGSLGNETSYFGIATREALKRFQALFIEFIEVANGKFGPKTRTSMNAVCKGPYFTGGSKNVYTLSTTTATTTEQLFVAVAGPSTTAIDEPVRAYVSGSRPIKQPTLTGLIISNATAQDMRKVSSTTYSFMVIPNEDATEPITLQFEADSVSDEKSIKNEMASNEWSIYLTGIATTTPKDEFQMPDIDLPIVDPSNIDCSTVSGVDINDYSNPCYGKAPITQANTGSPDSGGGGGGGKQPPDIMSMLKGLMDALKGAGGAGGGGSAGGDSKCACSGMPTSFHSSMGGTMPSGRYTNSKPRSGSKWTGQPAPPIIPCGFKIEKGQCIRPEADMTGMPVVQDNARIKYDQ